MVNFKENYHFSRFLRGQTFSRRGGGVPIAYSYRKYITCDFPGGGGGPDPCPPPLWIRTWDCPWYYPFMQRMHQILGMFLEGQVDRQTDRQTGAQTADAKTISLRLHRGGGVETSTEHRICSVMFKNTWQCFR